jgi:hypothetical protein
MSGYQVKVMGFGEEHDLGIVRMLEEAGQDANMESAQVLISHPSVPPPFLDIDSIAE